jgi:restriction endonuclease S subunit
MKRMLSKGEFEKIKLILPKLNIQQEFERKINYVIIQNEKVKNALANSGNLFQTLIQKALKGELVAE